MKRKKLGRVIKRYSGSIRYIFLGLIGLFVFIFLSKKRKNVTDYTTSNIYVNKNNLSINTDQLSVICKSIYDAMNKVGTDSEIIFSQLQKLNKDEILYIFKSFGVVRYQKLWGVHSDVIGVDLNLQGWLKEELPKTGKYSYDNLKVMFENKGIYIL
ncbi:MAG: hypothetical protein JXB49_30055 [Bacteroidales bacterium]|nr:hypothetical protein [Bacteroidales bacterium]